MGFIDKNTECVDTIGNDDFVVNYDEELCVVLAIGSPVLRKKLFSLYEKNPRVSFPNLIDPSVIISDRVSMGVGNIICANCVLTVNINIGNYNVININSTVGHDAFIGDFVTINPSVNISGNSKILDESNIGTGVQIIQGLTIHKSCIIGAGAVVTKDILDNCTAVGVPAKVIKINGSLSNG